RIVGWKKAPALSKRKPGVTLTMSESSWTLDVSSCSAPSVVIEIGTSTCASSRRCAVTTIGASSKASDSAWANAGAGAKAHTPSKANADVAVRNVVMAIFSSLGACTPVQSGRAISDPGGLCPDELNRSAETLWQLCYSSGGSGHDISNRPLV